MIDTDLKLHAGKTTLKGGSARAILLALHEYIAPSNDARISFEDWYRQQRSFFQVRCGIKLPEKPDEKACEQLLDVLIAANVLAFPVKTAGHAHK